MWFKRSTLRYGETPEPVTPYQKAAQVWDERIGTRPRPGAQLAADRARQPRAGADAGGIAALARPQRHRPCRSWWRSIATGRGARRRAAAEAYRPSDAQIAFHLARFIENVRSLSIDPVVVRQNWLRAYDFVTDRAAVTLNEHARENDPFAGRPHDRRRRDHQRRARVRLLVPGALAGAGLRERRRSRIPSASRPPLHRHHPAAHRRGRAQEPARHLRPRLQLVAGRHRGRAK